MNPSARPGAPDETRALFDAVSGWTGSRPYAVIELPAPLGVTEALLEALPDEDAIFLAPRDEAVVVGLGVAVAATSQGPERLADVQRRADTFTKAYDRVALEGADAGPVQFLGGFAFEPEPAHGDWARFGSARFVVPRWTYRRAGDVASLRLVLLAAEAPRMAGRVVAEYASILAALRRGVLAPPVGTTHVARSDAERYVRAVGEAVDRIHAREVDKVVLARETVVEADTPFSPARILAALAKPSPALVFAVRTSGKTFLGASPERLVRVHGRQATTEALAGTAASKDELASTKNLDEHQHVVRWIRDRLEPLSEAVVAPDRPQTRTLPHVVHLVTPVESRLLAPMHVLRVADALYPTSAIGGAPLGVALRTIRAAEQRPRGWYAGAVGAFDTEGTGELFVALRSALVEGRRARVFVGAGIVSDSEPAAELAETIAKEQTMLDALRTDEAS
ncbi:MAG: isochorismate synthase [Deltaproteobacteria bacterium]